MEATLADKHLMFSLIVNIKENDGSWAVSTVHAFQSVSILGFYLYEP